MNTSDRPLTALNSLVFRMIVCVYVSREMANGLSR